MRRILFAVLLIVACATGAAADSIEEAEFAYDRGDYTRAARLFRPLAEQGLASAQNNLGLMYENGRGVRRDLIRAHMWYGVAAAALSGDEGKAAMKRRDDVASRMPRRRSRKRRRWRGAVSSLNSKSAISVPFQPLK